MQRLFHGFCLVVCLTLALAGGASSAELSFDNLLLGNSGGGFDFSQPSGFALKQQPLLRAALIPETSHIAPGKPFRVAVELNHSAGAYSYWANPGGPGVPTEVEWQLPDGFSVSGPEWPTPEKYDSAGFPSYVLKGRSGLVYTITPPKTLALGSEITLAGEVASQVCTSKTCNPVTLEVETSVTASPQPGQPNPDAGALFASLPQQPKNWNFELGQADGMMVLDMKPAGTVDVDLRDVYFFDSSADPILDPAQPQKLVKTDAGWRLEMPLRSVSAGDADADSTQSQTGIKQPASALVGVLSSRSGWFADSDGPQSFALNLDMAAGGPPMPGLRLATRHNVPLLLLFAFLGGLILNVMPCVFPVIGLKIMSFAKQAHKDRRAVFLHGASYAAGVLLCFWTLAFLVITMGRGWGAQLQSDWFLFLMCHLFMVMSLNMAGVFDIGASVAGAGQSLNRREGLKRSFFTGLLATLTSTPCSAPFLGTALAYALSLPPALSMGVFTLMGLGFAFPYLALSLFPNLLKKLPKPGPWMETFRQAMSFPLFATTAYLFWTMEAMLEEWRFLMLLFGLVLTGMACWLYGKSQRRHHRSERGRYALTISAFLVLGVGLWLGLPKGDRALEWQTWSPETVAALRREGKAVYVDFTARWCATCQVNKRVYQDKSLAEALLEKEVVLLKADWTKYDERITTTLKNEFNKAAVPVTVLYAPGENEANVLPEILTVASVKEALEELP